MGYVDSDRFKQKAAGVRLLMSGRKMRLDRELRAIERERISEALSAPADSASRPDEALLALSEGALHASSET